MKKASIFLIIFLTGCSQINSDPKPKHWQYLEKTSFSSRLDFDPYSTFVIPIWTKKGFLDGILNPPVVEKTSTSEYNIQKEKP